MNNPCKDALCHGIVFYDFLLNRAKTLAHRNLAGFRNVRNAVMIPNE